MIEVQLVKAKKKCGHLKHLLVLVALMFFAAPISPYYLIFWAFCWLETKR